MAFDLSKLFASSFRGVAFLTDVVTEAGGQKTITHEFVNSDEPFVESVGILQPTFSVLAIVHGDNYLSEKNALRNAMQIEGTATFLHPFEGRINVYPISYSINQTDRELGQAIFTLNFKKVSATSIGLPIATQSNLNSISTFTTNAGNAIAAFIGTTLDFTSVDNFVAISDTLDSVGDAFQNIVGTTNGLASKISASRATIDNFKADFTGLINTPAVLGTNIIALFSSVTDLFATSEETFSQLTNLYPFGDAIGADEDTTFFPINPDNRLATERQLNQNIVKTAIQTNALAQSYLSASQITFNNVTDIDVVIGVLDAQFIKTVGNVETGEADVDTVAVMDTTTVEVMTDLRNEVRLFLDAERVNALKLTTVDTKPTPMSVLAYKYYGNVELLDQLVSINDPGDISNIEGDISVLIE